MKNQSTPNTAVTETARPEAKTPTAKSITKTVKVRVPRTIEFAEGDTVAYTVTEDGAKMRFGTVVDFTDEKIIVQTLSGRFIERHPIPALLVKVPGKPEDYADQLRTIEVPITL